MKQKKIVEPVTIKQKKITWLMAAQMDAARLDEKTGLCKPKTIIGKIIAELRMRQIQKIVFEKTYWENDKSLKEFVAQNDVIILQVIKGENPAAKFDYHLRNTEAKKVRLWTVRFVNKNAYTTNVLGFSITGEHFKLGII